MSIKTMSIVYFFLSSILGYPNDPLNTLALRVLTKKWGVILMIVRLV